MDYEDIDKFISYPTLVLNSAGFKLRLVHQRKMKEKCDSGFDEYFIIYLLAESSGFMDGCTIRKIYSLSEGDYIYSIAETDNTRLIGKRVIFTNAGVKEEANFF